MILKRRDKPSLAYRLREAIAPRKGFWRGMGYIGKRMKRITDTPHRIALGFACGALASFTPFFTLHFFLAAFLAWIARASIMAGLFGTIVGNPLTFGPISAASLGIGRWMMGRGSEGASGFDAIMDSFGGALDSIGSWISALFGGGPAEMEGLYQFFDEVFLPYLIGGIVPGLICGSVFYILLYRGVGQYQERRRARLEKVQAKRREAFDEEMGAYGSHDGREGDGV